MSRSTSKLSPSDDSLVVLAVPAKRSNSKPLRVRLGPKFQHDRNLTVFSFLFKIGRWPEKSVKFILRLLKNAESNADAKGIELEDIVVKNIVVQQAPVRQP